MRFGSIVTKKGNHSNVQQSINISAKKREQKIFIVYELNLMVHKLLPEIRIGVKKARIIV